MEKITVDVTEADGKRWTVGRLVTEAIEREYGTNARNRVLSILNRVGVSGTDETYFDTVLRYVNLVVDGEIIASEDLPPANFPLITPEEQPVPKKTEALVREQKQAERDAQAAEYLAIVEEMSVEDVGYASTVEFLADVKEITTAIESERKELTKGARDTVAKINKKFKTAEDTYKAAEKILKDKLIEYRADVNEIRDKMIAAGIEPPEPVPDVAGVSIRERLSFVINEDELPAEFWAPDTGAIEKAVKEGREIPGVLVEKVESLAIEHKKVKR